MKNKSKKVLKIDLQKKTYEANSYPDLHQYIGGVALGIKLLENNLEHDPIAFSVGPLNGFFPFASKTSIALVNNNVVEDLYLGGALSLRIKFAGFDSIVINGKSEHPVILNISSQKMEFIEPNIQIGSLGLPGKKSVIRIDDKTLVDSYFTAKEDFLTKKLSQKNIKGIVITGTEVYKPQNMEKYIDLYHSVLSRKNEVDAEKKSNPSCSNCPLGCDKSKIGEIGGNVLIHSLVVCQYAERIYSDIGLVFSCLNVLGYDYTHEDIENLPGFIEETLAKF